MKKEGYFLGIPYDFRMPTWKLMKERFWNKHDQRLFTPKIFGWGYSLNIYQLFHKKKRVFMMLASLCFLLGILAVIQISALEKAHSTFENYYAFRGCQTLIERKETYGICKTNAGETIKIVKYKEKLYLDGDLPCGFLCF